MSERSCRSCTFCGTIIGQNKTILYICRKRPPHTQLLPMPSAQGVQLRDFTLWPEIKVESDWCGEWEPEPSKLS